MITNNANFDLNIDHQLVTALTLATQSGEVAKIKRLLKNMKFSGALAKTSSLVLGAIDPLENPTLSAERLWGCKPHKVKEKRI